MKKLVIKTVIITVIAILAVCIAVMSAFWIFKPRVIAKMFDDLGSYKASQYFYEMQYNKTGEISDLLELIDNAYEKQDSMGLRTYLGKLISDNDFNAYCNSQNSGIAPNSIKAEEYYAGWYAEILYETGDINLAIAFAKTYVLNNDGSVNMGYTQFNPFRTLANKNLELTEPQKQALKNAILDLQASITDEFELGYISEDLNKLN